MYFCVKSIMRYFREIKIGASSYWDAFVFLKRKRMLWMIGIPAVLMLGVYQIGTLLQAHHVEVQPHSMNDIVWYSIRLLGEITVGLMLMKFSKYLVVILLSPLFAYLSQKSAYELTGESTAFRFHQFVADVKRAMRLALRNIFWLYGFLLLIYGVSYFATGTTSHWTAVLLTFFVSAYYYGFSFLDYVNERRMLTVSESISFVRHHRFLAVSIGSIYSALILMPVNLAYLFDWSSFGTAPMAMISHFLVHLTLWICAAAAPVLASVSATFALHKLEK